MDITPHKVISSGLEHVDLSIELPWDVDCVWSDPPWGPGLVKWFYTHNKNRVANIEWDTFLSLFTLACSSSCPRGPIYVTMGNDWVLDLKRAFEKVGVSEIAHYTVYYKSSSGSRPCTLWVGSKAPQKYIPPIMPLDVAGGPEKNQALDRVVKWSLENHSDIKSVFDPCCGVGQTAKVAVPLGLTFYGVELNPDRAKRTFDLIAKLKNKGV